MSLINSTVSENQAGDGYTNGINGGGGAGGGIYARGGVSLLNSTVSDNRAGDGGYRRRVGGYDPFTGIDDGLDGSDGGDGGGIYVRGAVSLINTTVSGNRAGNGGDGGLGSADISPGNGGYGGSGGGIYARIGDMTLANSTVTGNTTGFLGFGGYDQFSYASNGRYGEGGGVFVKGFSTSSTSSTTFTNTIIAGNASPFPGSRDVTARYDVMTINHSLIGNADGLTFTGGNNQLGTVANPLDALLGPLGINGGQTQTHALLSGSPAIDAGDNTLAVDADGLPLANDQRGAGFGTHLWKQY